MNIHKTLLIAAAAVLAGAAVASAAARTSAPVPRGAVLTASVPAITRSATLAPSITSFWPMSGHIGTPVLITGQNFVHVEDVEFNGTSVWVLAVLSSTRIRAVVSPGTTTGPIEVVTDYGTATSAHVFTVRPGGRR